MQANTDINRVAVVGTGLIGSSWAACFLAHGLDVVATDPAPGTEDKVRQYVEAAWAALTKIGLTQGASTSRLRFESNLKEALAGVDMVQENAPEREPLKTSGRRTGWYTSLPRAFHGFDDGVLGRSRLSRSSESRTAEKDCGRRAGGDEWPLIRGAVPGA